MVIDICNIEKAIKLNAGDVIVARHKIKTGKVLHYQLVEDGDAYRLLNLKTKRLMATFNSLDPVDAIGYIEVAVSAEIIDIVPASKLKLTTVSVSDI